MNWGYKITLVIVAFVLIMVSMVFVAFKQSNEMIDSNYYEKELKYQSLINASENLYNISKDDLIKQNEQNLTVQLPQGLYTDFSGGKLEFVRNDDQKKDINLSFSPDSKGFYSINKSVFSSGNYIARIQWTNNDKAYYQEHNIIIQK